MTFKVAQIQILQSELASFSGKANEPIDYTDGGDGSSKPIGGASYSAVNDAASLPAEDTESAMKLCSSHCPLSTELQTEQDDQTQRNHLNDARHATSTAATAVSHNPTGLGALRVLVLESTKRDCQGKLNSLATATSELSSVASPISPAVVGGAATAAAAILVLVLVLALYSGYWTGERTWVKVGQAAAIAGQVRVQQGKQRSMHDQAWPDRINSLIRVLPAACGTTLATSDAETTLAGMMHLVDGKLGATFPTQSTHPVSTAVWS